MTINRRQLLKTFAISPLALTWPVKAAAKIFGSTAGACNCINIVLHGFFFLEFQKDENGKDMLVVATPPYKPHTFGCRDHGKWRLQAPSMCDSDLRTRLTPGSKLNFPTRMLSFSKTDLQLSGNFINAANNYPILLLLPPPADIVPLRLGKRSDLHLNDGNVKTSIDNYCDPTYLGLVLRLKYAGGDLILPKTRSYYAEHCNLPDITEMKKVLQAARDTFSSKFDLDMPDIPPAVVSLDKQKDLPDEISPDDESAIMEADPCFAPNPKSLERNQAHLNEGPRNDQRSVEPATCPLFGVRS